MKIPLTITCPEPKIKHDKDSFAFFLRGLRCKIIPALHDDIETLLNHPEVVNLMEKCWQKGYNIGNSTGYEAGYDDGWEASSENDYYE